MWIFCHISESEFKSKLLSIDIKGIIKAYLISKEEFTINNFNSGNCDISKENIITPLFGILSRLINDSSFLSYLNENFSNIIYICINKLVNNYKILKLDDLNTYKQVVKLNTSFQDNIIDILSIIFNLSKKDFNIVKLVLDIESKLIIVILEKIFTLNIIQANLKETAIILYVYLVNNSNQDKDFYYGILEMRMKHISSLKENKCNVVVVMLESLRIIQICIEKLVSLKENVITNELITKLSEFQANNVKYDGPLEIHCRKIVRYLKKNINLIN